MASQVQFIEAPGTIPDQLQPYNHDAEEAVLGGLLIDPGMIFAVLPFLSARDFYIVKHGQIYQAISDLTNNNRPADLLTICDELARKDQLDNVGGPAYLSGLINVTPSALHVEYYGRIVERDAVRRRLMDGAGEMARMAFGWQGEADELLAQSEKIVMDVSKGHNREGSSAKVSQVVDEIHADIDRLYAAGGKAVLGLPTGLADLDKKLGGLQRSDLIVIGGRPGMGKTALATQIAAYAAKKHQARSLIFSLEMSRKQLTRRMISAESGIEENRIKSAAIKEDEWTTYQAAAEVIAGLPIVINDAPYWTPQQLRAEAIRHAARYGLDLIILDYLQLMADESGWKNRHQEISEISRMCKVVARELDVPFVALSQLSRRCEERHDKRPMLSDLRESGAIEADADIVLFVYRDEIYNPKVEYPGLAEVIIAKHRNGPTGAISLFFRDHLTQFTNLEQRRISLDSIDFGK